jgi:hypothetical protein
MKLDPARWPASSVPAIPALIIALLAVLTITGVLHGTAGGVLFAVGVGAFGAIIWRADGIAWLDTASWTVPLSIWMLVAWVSFSEVPYLAAGLVAAAWLASFIFWLPPVRWWYRWVLRRDFPFRSRGAAQLHDLHFAIGQALQQYSKDADASVLHLRSEELLSRTIALTIGDPGADATRALLVRYLESLRSITADPWNMPPTAFESLNDQVQAFREALDRLSGAPA